MTRCIPILALMVASCSGLTFGTTTTQRPAIVEPAIRPDGTFWDAATVAEKGDVDAFLYLLSPQMVYLALFPEARLSEVDSQESFTRQRARVEAELEPFANVVEGFANRYMAELRGLLKDRFIEAGEPKYFIMYTGVGGRAEGPNLAEVDVSIYPKTSMGEDDSPEVLSITFIQDGRRWLIHKISPDPLKGAFVR